MELAVLVPVACTALDMALDASGGGVAVLSCGSGRKLKTALRRSLTGPQTPAVRQRPPMSAGTGPSRRAGAQGMWCAAAPQHRWSSSAIRALTDPTRPAVSDCASVRNPRGPAACLVGEASWISDPGLLLSDGETAMLQRVLEDINKETGVQCALAVFADLQGGDRGDATRFRRFGVQLFNTWGVGSATHDNGVLFLFLREARRLEIVTGKGMSSALPDQWVQRMMHSTMVPRFRANDHGAGLLAGATAIQERLLGHAHPQWRPDLGIAPEHPDGKVMWSATPQFHGGQAPTARPEDSKSTAWRDFQWVSPLSSLLMLGFWGAGASENDSSPERDVRRLVAKLAELRGRSTFRDASGADVPWPYQVSPANMGLADVTSAPGPHEQHHAFELSSSGALALDAQASGFGNGSLAVRMRNTGGDSLAFDLPAGSLFVAPPGNGCRLQPLITRQAVSVELGPGEEKELLLDAYCGDSGARVPRGNMSLSPYTVSDDCLSSQAAVWRWSAPFQPNSERQFVASEDFRTLEESFGMSRQEAQELFGELADLIARGTSDRERQEVALQLQLEEARAQAAAVTYAQTHRSPRTNSSGSSGGRSRSMSFGGGSSSGGGGGCSW
mmetsp:Transcript_119301/g.380334  ORF Transcript_119301/g.380334 Transcript_119301/m.380334 type:complete len:614 (-) Transcript_119301:220-2061(-)|eukprot:CAMPEP_0203911900 /NCGR_PEP_ID=MMETSP0359-20131031/53033_1 /ASSEMBLY_ACC=CAM_ASM_000338 /TAXON_ID=268821 /ORGANISM="Scrippsiella Hangoei, Strain SHTV-5" /LENGTH=613 /DNA_ID=CAMNT_0050837731 /DNA_START=58 /DNA_END=1899 /DNA_ORIENTATION=+